MRNYSSLFSYSYFVDNAIVHDSAHVSIACEAAGSDLFLSSMSQDWLTAFNEAPDGITFEVHAIRTDDISLIKNYLKRGSPRSSPVIEHLKKEHAEHLARYAKVNHIFLVLTKKAKSKSARSIAQVITELNDYAIKSLSIHCGARLIDRLEFEALINHSLNGKFESVQTDGRLLLNDQLAHSKPEETERGYYINNQYYRSGLLYLYPEVSVGWVAPILRASANLHISHVIKPLSRDAVETETDRQQRQIRQLSDDKHGLQRQVKKSQDISSFAAYILEHQLSTYRNAYYVSVMGDDVEEVDQQWANIRLLINRTEGAELLDGHQYAIPAYQYMAPAQGYLSPFLRTDHSDQILGMLPVHASPQGNLNPTNLRLRFDGTPYGYSVVDMDTPHALTIAKTGAGKGINSCFDIVENFAQGINHAILEIGTSYQWVIEALGGKYLTINPDESSINPLPTYQEYTDTSEPTALLGTVEMALSYILTSDNRLELTTFEAAALSQALNVLYEEAATKKGSPRLINLKEELEAITDDQIGEAGQQMAATLGAYLKTNEGASFNSENNIDLDADIVGVNLKQVSNNVKLLRFYIVFLSVKFQARAFSGTQKMRVVLDETHQFSAEAPEAFARLVRLLTRTGRKEGAYTSIISQNLSEIESLDSETIGSMSITNLLYRPTEHAEFADKLGLENDTAIRYWSSLPDPEGKPYRQGLMMVSGQPVDLFLSFGHDALLLGSTSETDLKIKQTIPNGDPLERLAKLRELKERK